MRPILGILINQDDSLGLESGNDVVLEWRQV